MHGGCTEAVHLKKGLFKIVAYLTWDAGRERERELVVVDASCAVEWCHGVVIFRWTMLDGVCECCECKRNGEDGEVKTIKEKKEGE